MLNNPYSKKEVIKYLKENSIFPNKNRGQNFLCDENIARNIANTVAKDSSRGKYALEIGGGLGSLSRMLINIYKDNLTIVEYDKALYNHLKNEYPKINIIHKDILNVNISEIKDDAKFDIYGNIPYNIASPIMEWLFCDSYEKWNYAVFTVQSDFANRLTAKEDSEDYSSLTLFSKFMSNIKLEGGVSKEAFYPVPKVNSSVISVIPKEINLQKLDTFKSVSKTLFHNRRKNVKNNLINSPYINLKKDKIDEILKKADIEKDARGESLNLKKVEELSDIIEEYI